MDTVNKLTLNFVCTRKKFKAIYREIEMKENELIFKLELLANMEKRKYGLFLKYFDIFTQFKKCLKVLVKSGSENLS